MPDEESEQVNDAVTSVLFQPFVFAAGVREPVIVGAPLSSLTVTEPFPTFPSLSVAVAVFAMPGVFCCCESAAGVGPDATPDPPSVADQAMLTLLLFHPAALAAGETAAVKTGPALSSTYEALCGLWDTPVQL